MYIVQYPLLIDLVLSLFISCYVGILLGKIKHDKLPDTPGQMSIREDELAVPTWDNKHVCLFKINR